MKQLHKINHNTIIIQVPYITALIALQPYPLLQINSVLGISIPMPEIEFSLSNNIAKLINSPNLKKHIIDIKQNMVRLSRYTMNEIEDKKLDVIIKNFNIYKDPKIKSSNYTSVLTLIPLLSSKHIYNSISSLTEVVEKTDKTKESTENVPYKIDTSDNNNIDYYNEDIIILKTELSMRGLYKLKFSESLQYAHTIKSYIEKRKTISPSLWKKYNIITNICMIQIEQ